MNTPVQFEALVACLTVGDLGTVLNLYVRQPDKQMAKPKIVNLVGKKVKITVEVVED